MTLYIYTWKTIARFSWQMSPPAERETSRAVVAAPATPVVLKLSTPSIKKTFSIQVPLDFRATAVSPFTTRLIYVMVLSGDVAPHLGQHGAFCHPGGGERGIRGRGFKTQPAAMLERRTGVEHAASELGGHSCREQVGPNQVFIVKISWQCVVFFGFVLSDVLAVASQDRILSVFSSCGRRLLPAIQLATPVSALHCSTHFVMVLTAGATLSVWSVASRSDLRKLQIEASSVK